jgi:hypothetical protein
MLQKGYKGYVLQKRYKGYMLQKIQAHYFGIAKKGLTLGYIPKTWLKARGIFIPKPGKEDYSNPRLYNLVKLTSFQPKVMERLIRCYRMSNSEI